MRKKWKWGQAFYWGVLFSLLGVVSSSSAFANLGGKTEMPQVSTVELTNDISLDKVRIHRVDDRLWWFRKPVVCDQGFFGTHAGNRIYLRLSAQGGSGKYRHELTYDFPDSYNMEFRDGGQQIKVLKKNGVVSIDIPRLKEGVPFIYQYFTLVTTDSNGNKTMVAKKILVSRNFLLKESKEELSCKETYTPKIVSAEMGNQTTMPSLVDIKKTEEKIYGKSTNKQFGIFINPIVGFPPGMFVSLFALNYSIFKDVTQQTIEIYDVTQQFSLSPGEYLQVYRQDTRIVQAYDAAQVDACGHTVDLPQAYMIQKWLHAYHAVVVDPNGEPRPLKSIGAEVKNTCAEVYNLEKAVVLNKGELQQAHDQALEQTLPAKGPDLEQNPKPAPLPNADQQVEPPLASDQKGDSVLPPSLEPKKETPIAPKTESVAASQPVVTTVVADAAKKDNGLFAGGND